MQSHAWNEFGRKEGGGGGDAEYVEKGRELLVGHEVRVCLLCRPMILIRIFLPSFLAMYFASFSYLTLMRMLCAAHFAWDFLTGFWYFLWAIIVRFPYESSCFLLHHLLMRIHAFWAATSFHCESSCFLALMRFHEISQWAFMLFDPNKISLWDFMLIWRLPYTTISFLFCRCKIFFWDFMLFGCYETSLRDFMLCEP